MAAPPPGSPAPARQPHSSSQASRGEDTTCPRCQESRELAKVKGCIRCLTCGFKFDCNGW